MSYCLNHQCCRPQNPDSARFCSTCGFKLLLGDRYRSLELIGGGESSRVFLAEDEYKPSRPKCIIKQVSPQSYLPDPEQAKALFRREAVQLDQLGSHAQIPELLAHFEERGYQYLVQELIDGQNLTQEVAATGAFSETQVWHLLNNLLPVLEFVHRHQVIHRDIKPQNIIRRHTDHQYVLVDFGSSKSTQSHTQTRTGIRLGSSEFTAPEQAIGKATFASDLYSLGVTCIYLLTQRHPADLFDEAEGNWVWRYHLKHPVNSALGDILDKMLRGPIKLRYQSTTEVLRDLHSPVLLHALKLTPPPAPRQSWPSSRNFTVSRPNHRLPPPPPPLRDRALAQDRQGPLQSAGKSVSTPNPAIDAPSPILAPDIMPEGIPERRLPVAGLMVDPRATWTCRQTLTGHLSWVRSVVIHPSGQMLASGSGDKTIKLWNLETGELLRIIPAHAAWIRALAVSPDGQLLASGGNDKTVKLWNWHTGDLLYSLEDNLDWVRSVAFSLDGQILASSSQDKTIRLWDVKTGTLLNTLRGHRHWVTTIAFAPQVQSTPTVGPRLISGSCDKSMGVWDWKTGQLVAALTGHGDAINQIATQSTLKLLASGSDDGTVRLWTLDTGKLLQTLTGHKGAVNSVAISPDGSTLASASQDRTVKIWCPQTGALLQTLTGHSNWIWSLAMSPDGQTIASGSRDGTIKLWSREF